MVSLTSTAAPCSSAACGASPLDAVILMLPTVLSAPSISWRLLIATMPNLHSELTTTHVSRGGPEQKTGDKTKYYSGAEWSCADNTTVTNNPERGLSFRSRQLFVGVAFRRPARGRPQGRTA